MPSLIFHEGNLRNEKDQEKNAAPIVADGTLSVLPQVFRVGDYAGYNPTARRLMWLAVTVLTLVVLLMWVWSMMNQFYTVKWSASPENTFINDLRNSWDKSFHAGDGQPLSAEQLKIEVKENLVKLFASAASSTTSTPEINTSTN